MDYRPKHLSKISQYFAVLDIVCYFPLIVPDLNLTNKILILQVNILILKFGLTNLLLKLEPGSPRRQFNNFILCIINVWAMFKVYITFCIAWHSKNMIANHWCYKTCCQSATKIIIHVFCKYHIIQPASLCWVFLFEVCSVQQTLYNKRSHFTVVFCCHFTRICISRKKCWLVKTQRNDINQPFYSSCWKIAKHTLKILRCLHRKIFKVSLTIFQHYE